MSVQWTEDLATGVERIDEQHRELYHHVARLHEAMRTARLGDVPAIMDFLQRYALEHFATEEREMAAARYPGLEVHRRLHQRFVDDLLRQRALIAAGLTASAVVDLSHWLSGWLGEHVRKVDGEMARFLRHLEPR